FCRHLVVTVICVFFSHDTAPAELYTLSLHDALPILSARSDRCEHRDRVEWWPDRPVHPGSRPEEPRLHRQDVEGSRDAGTRRRRSEEHTSELQSRENLVCRLLLEKKKNNTSDTKQTE